MTTMTATRSLETASRLRNVLFFDGVLCAVMGAALTTLTGQVDGFLGISETFLRWSGVLLLPWAALVLLLASRKPLSRASVLVVIGGNVAWSVASVLLLITGTLSPTGAGYAFVIAQAILVLALADIQILSLRKAGR